MSVAQRDAFDPIVGSGVALRRRHVDTDELQPTLVCETPRPLDRTGRRIRAIVAYQDSCMIAPSV